MNNERTSLEKHLVNACAEPPAVLCARYCFMTDSAVRNIERIGKVMLADYEIAKKVNEVKPQVIISEYYSISSQLMDLSPNLKGIIACGVGFDHIDVEAASERGIYVANARGSNSESVAEHVVAVMLGLSRKVLKADAFVRKGDWVSRETKLSHRLTAQDLYGKTLGIIGLGAIGSRVARIAKGFEMRVLAYDPHMSVEVAKERGAELVNLTKLLTDSDFVTLHVVLNEKTKGMISTRELNLLKPTAYLINASRGPVVNEKALIRALQEKKIAGAGLDVFTKEPIDLENPLLKFDNVIVTPHCAGNSLDALNAISMMVSEEAVRILQGELPKNLVNRAQLTKKGYLS
jgi:D-3-phosphoglycerate dehydrogenase